jgi:MerR family transcriptional regulator, mercuric resistance operon regulatory protein
MQLTIGKLAKQSEVTIETIRYYQQIGLLDEPEKPSSGYRLYPPDAINRIRFIKRAQQAGFTLKEIAELLSFDGTHCSDVRQIAEQKCQQIDTQIEALIALRKVLGNLVKRCQTDASTERCSLIDTLSTARDGGSAAIGREPMLPNEKVIKS